MMAKARKYSKDLVQVGLPSDMEPMLDDLHNSEVVPWFDSQQAVYRFAVALAIGREVEVTEKFAEKLSDCKNKWRCFDDQNDPGRERGIDGSGSVVRDMVTAFRPEEANVYFPYRFSQLLAIKGIHMLHEELYKKEKDMDKILSALFEVDGE